MSDTTKIIIFVNHRCYLCSIAIGFKVANEGKSVTSGSRKFNEMASYQDSSNYLYMTEVP